jgi:hypothetical protein
MQNLGFRNFVSNAVRVAITVLFVFAIGLIHPVNYAFAQRSTSGVNGVVTDHSGAVIPGAMVKLKNADTNVERNTVSGGSGDYFFTGLPPARYSLFVSAATFETETISPFVVGVDQVVTVDVPLKVGNVNQSITVEATNTEVESSTAQLGSIIDTKAVNDLPLNGRNFTQLLDLTPGVAPISTGLNSGGGTVSMVGGAGTLGAQVNFSFPSVNGGTNRSTMYMMDGMSNDNNIYGTYALPPIIDTIAEFKVNSHNDSVYGGVVGGVVNVVTKSGTNSLHGSAWEFSRSNSYDAKPFFFAPPSYHLNTFGAQAGGPVLIPKVYNGKNKTFFEVGFESTHLEDAYSADYLEPTAAELGQSTWGAAPDLPYMDFSSAQTGAAGNCLATASTVSTGSCQLYDPTVSNFAPSPCTFTG